MSSKGFFKGIIKHESKWVKKKEALEDPFFLGKMSYLSRFLFGFGDVENFWNSTSSAYLVFFFSGFFSCTSFLGTPKNHQKTMKNVAVPSLS